LHPVACRRFLRVAAFVANLYLLCWDYDKLKFILAPKSRTDAAAPMAKPSNRFPFRFFTGVFATIIITGLIITNAYVLMPRNTFRDCQMQCDDAVNPEACNDFCDCIHNQGQSYDKCFEIYKNTITKKRTENE
jgi:hypothetical protein